MVRLFLETCIAYMGNYKRTKRVLHVMKIKNWTQMLHCGILFKNALLYYIYLFLTKVLTAANYSTCLAKDGYCIMLHIFKGDILILIWYAKLVSWCPYSLLLILSQDDSIYLILILLISLVWGLGLVGCFWG